MCVGASRAVLGCRACGGGSLPGEASRAVLDVRETHMRSGGFAAALPDPHDTDSC